MPFSVREVMEVLSVLSKEENLQVTIKQAAKGGLVAGGGAFIGALIAGPVGMAVGGTVGALAGSAMATNFKPLATVLKELPGHKQQELADRINNIVSSLDHTDLFSLLAVVQGSGALRMQVLNALIAYFAQVEGTPVKSC